MKLSELTQEVINNFAAHNQSMLFLKGSRQYTISDPGKRLFAIADLDQEFPEEFGVAELSKFKSALSLFEDPDLEFCGDRLEIRAGKKKLSYQYAAKSVLKVPSDGLISKASLKTEDVSTVLEHKTLVEVLKAQGALGLPEVAVVGDGSDLVLRTYDSKKPTATGFSVTIGSTDKVFTLVFSPEHLKVLPRDYQLTVSLSRLMRLTSPGITYYVGAEDTSKV